MSKLRAHSIQSVTKATASVFIDAFNPAIDASRETIDSFDRPIINALILSTTDSEANLRLHFDREILRATVRIGIESTACRSGLNDGGALTQLVLEAEPYTGPNYVQAISFPYGNTFKVGDVCKVKITLKREADNNGDKIMWLLQPHSAFSSVDEDSPWSNPNISLVPSGDNIVYLSFQSEKCPGKGDSVRVYIQTWMHNMNTELLPYFRQAPFNITCPR